MLIRCVGKTGITVAGITFAFAKWGGGKCRGG